MFKYEYTVDSTFNIFKFIEVLEDSQHVPYPASISAPSPGGLELAYDAQLTTEQETDLNDLVAAFVTDTLLVAKEQKIAEIDQRTADLIAEGFEFGGYWFSGSMESQSRVIAAYTARNVATYPIRWLTKDNMAYIDIVDSTMLTQFFLTGFSVLKAKIDAGSVLKTAVASATTIEEINLIVDAR